MHHLITQARDLPVGVAVLAMLRLAIAADGWGSLLLGSTDGLFADAPLTLPLVFEASASPFRRLAISLLAGVLGLGFGIITPCVGATPRRRSRSWWLFGAPLCLGTLATFQYEVFWQWQVSHRWRAGSGCVRSGTILAPLESGPAVGLVA